MTVYEMIDIAGKGENGTYCAVYYQDDDKPPELGFLQHNGHLIIICKLCQVEIDGLEGLMHSIPIPSNVMVHRYHKPLWVEADDAATAHFRDLRFGACVLI